MTVYETLTPEAFVRELMHGDKDSLKRGYSPENAALAVQRTKDLDATETDLLLAHGMGFHDAVHTMIEPGFEPLLEDWDEWPAVKRSAYERGHAHGLNADLGTIRLS